MRQADMKSPEYVTAQDALDAVAGAGEALVKVGDLVD